ncbi:hypothetical protein V3W47_12915 [Deinococcus sp. YIM 134068]|uniref:hypothetical protein n=1 Tax=Deinococcus lichenicola TaxID=3118910 RepID=UPI002F92F778
MSRALTLLAALALSALPPTAGATTVPPLTLTQQAKKAEIILRATPGTPSNVTENGVTWLAYPLTVTEAIVGDPATLPQREGKPVLYVLAGVEGLPELRAGQEAFFLLYRARMDNPIVGFTQGIYPIENGRVTRLGETARTETTTPPEARTPPAPGTTATTPTGNTTAGTSTPATASADAANAVPPVPPTAANSPEPSAANPSGVATLPPPSPPVGGTPPATAPTTTTPATATTTPTPPVTPPTPTPTAPDPNAIESDPARFRAALLAARGGQ